MMINVSLLKKQILDLAFSGKLTEHKSNESSNNLINMLFKNKQKKYASFSHELVNFEIPPNWNWCMTYQAVSLDNGTESEGELLPYLEVKYLRTGKEPKIINSGVIVDKGEKLILVDGENSGEVFLANNRGYKGSTMKILNISNAFIDKYIFLFIYSCKEGFRKNKTGAAIPHLDKKRLFETPLPIPPLQEQKRIVEKLDEIFAELDKIDEKQTRLATIQEKMEAKILKLAIQGKLVEQRPEEGTGEELLKLIQEEKLELIKQGKIKKEKTLSAVEEGEIPFEIPSTWKWTKFASISINRDSERIPLSVSSRKKMNKIFDYYGAAGVIDKVDNYLFDESLLLIGEDGANLVTRSKPNALIANGKYWVNNHAHVIKFTNDYIMKFVTTYINSIQLDPFVTGSAQPKLNQEKLNNIPIPLPPLEEQKRIVAKLEEFYELYKKG